MSLMDIPLAIVYIGPTVGWRTSTIKKQQVGDFFQIFVALIENLDFMKPECNNFDKKGPIRCLLPSGTRPSILVTVH